MKIKVTGFETKYPMKIKILSILFSLALILSVAGQSNAQIRVGVILPLMKNSENASEKVLGEEMLKGITDALEEFNSSASKNKVIIKTEDSKKNPERVLDIINEMGSDNKIVAIIGPVFSSEISSNAGAPAFHKISLITPTATENFLAENNEYLFQLNPTYETRGKLMGHYAVNELKMKRFIILSEETYGIKYAGAFTSEVLKADGNILFTKYFDKDSSDLSIVAEEIKSELLTKEKFIDFGKLNPEQIQNLRKMNFLFSNTDSLLNAGSIVSIYRIFGKNADRIIDSAGITSYSINYTDNSRNYIYGAVDAIYIPVSNPLKINDIMPALKTAGINLPIIGTSDWNNQKILEDNSAYISSVYFETDFYIKDKSRSDFTNISESEIKNYYLGYDAMMLVANLIGEGNTTRQKLYEALQKVSDVNGVHINFTIKDRSNHQMMIMRFENGKLDMVGDYVY